jgi:uncharacterized protein YjbJ (UPF0337 family)
MPFAFYRGAEVTFNSRSNRRSHAMSGKADQVKGRVKEAAGAIADDDKLRREGKIDQAAGKTKEAVEKVVDKTKRAAQGK